MLKSRQLTLLQKGISSAIPVNASIEKVSLKTLPQNCQVNYRVLFMNVILNTVTCNEQENGYELLSDTDPTSGFSC